MWSPALRRSRGAHPGGLKPIGLRRLDRAEAARPGLDDDYVNVFGALVARLQHPRWGS